MTRRDTVASGSELPVRCRASLTDSLSARVSPAREAAKTVPMFPVYPDVSGQSRCSASGARRTGIPRLATVAIGPRAQLHCDITGDISSITTYDVREM